MVVLPLSLIQELYCKMLVKQCALSSGSLPLGGPSWSKVDRIYDLTRYDLKYSKDSKPMAITATKQQEVLDAQVNEE